MTVFIDTAVIMYAVGGDHPYRDPSRRILDRVGAGTLDAETSIEVIQEIIHRFVSIRRPDLGRRVTTDALDLFAPVLPVTHATMRRLPDLIDRYPRLSARDLVHVATCQHEGISEIVSPDRGFDLVDGLRRLDPADFVG
ncbi:MAG: type II toxin-antitoxin system VapC family toxin [Candidatus Limnocylindrales bacterium]